MPGSVRTEPLPVLEMNLVQDVHRAATSLLTSVAHPDAPSVELAELRDFVVAALRHHHRSEDDALWPICEEAEPSRRCLLMVTVARSVYSSVPVVPVPIVGVRSAPGNST